MFSHSTHSGMSQFALLSRKRIVKTIVFALCSMRAIRNRGLLTLSVHQSAKCELTHRSHILRLALKIGSPRDALQGLPWLIIIILN